MNESQVKNENPIMNENPIVNENPIINNPITNKNLMTKEYNLKIELHILEILKSPKACRRQVSLLVYV